MKNEERQTYTIKYKLNMNFEFEIKASSIYKAEELGTLETIRITNIVRDAFIEKGYRVETDTEYLSTFKLDKLILEE